MRFAENTSNVSMQLYKLLEIESEGKGIGKQLLHSV